MCAYLCAYVYIYTHTHIPAFALKLEGGFDLSRQTK